MPNNPLHPETSVLYAKAIENGCFCKSLVPRASALISVWVERTAWAPLFPCLPKSGGGGGGGAQENIIYVSINLCEEE